MQGDHVKSVSFSEMNLRVGQRLQLKFGGPIEHKHYTSLIGYVENEFLILKVPQEDGWSVPVMEGQVLEVRLFSGVSIFTFESHVQTLLLNPRNYMLMSFPTRIQETRLRSHARVNISSPVEILQANVSDPQGFQLNDLSGGGASIVGPSPLGHKGADIQIALTFDLQSTGQKERVELKAVLQSIDIVSDPDAPNEATAYKHGVRFHAVDPRLILWVHELQNGKL